MKRLLRILPLLGICCAIPLTGSAALAFPKKSTPDKPPKVPMVGVYVTYLDVKPGQLLFKVNGKFVKTYKETWKSVEDPTVKAAILSAFYEHRSIDIPDYVLTSDKKSTALLAREIVVHPN